MKRTLIISLLVVAMGMIAFMGCERHRLESPSLPNTSWRLIAFVGNGVSTPVDYNCFSTDCFTINFKNNRKWDGVSSSNHMEGKYSVSNHNVKIEISLTTEISETEDGLKFVDKLGKVTSYVSASNQLRLDIDENESLLFERIQQ